MPRALTEAEAERVRTRLLHLAREHLTRGGLRKVSIESLVRAAGCSKGGFYRFFTSKEALWVEILRETETTLRVDLLQRARDQTRTGVEAVSDVLTAIMEAVHGHPMLRALADPEEMAWLLRGVEPEVLLQARADDDRFYRKLHRILRARGALGPAASVKVFIALPAAALALAQGRALFVGHDYAALTAFTVQAWTDRLAAG